MTAASASPLPVDVRAEYPFAGQTFTQPGGAVMHYLDEGSGPVVLMLHGNPTWSFYYRNLVKALSAGGFRCIVPDHIGCGLSDKPQDYAYTLQRRIDDVERLVDHLGIQRFSLIVHDWGGAIGCGLAGRRPDALEKLTLLNTAAFCSKRIPARIAAIKVPILGEAIIRGLNGFAGPAATMSVPRRCRGRSSVAYLALPQLYDRVAVWNFVKDIPLGPGHRSYAELRRVEQGLAQLQGKPVQLIWGGKDFCFNMHFYRRWLEFFPDAEQQLFPEHGHYILEDGRQSVDALVLKHLGA